MSRWRMVKNHARSRAIREAHDAGHEVSYNGERVYANGLLIYDSQATEAARQSLEGEAETKLWMYGEALKELAQEHQKYTSNYNMWQRWDDERRLWWIEHAEYQAEQGMQTIGVEVVSRAVTIRLTRSRG